MYDEIEIQGTKVSRAMYAAALKAVFDAIPKGKLAPLVRQMSVVEIVGYEAFRREPKQTETK